MRLPYKQKVILVITFSFGFFVAVVDVIRIAFLQQAAISRSLAVKSIHLQNNTAADFSCKPPVTPLLSWRVALIESCICRVRLALVHVVRRRSQRLRHMRLCTESQTTRRSLDAEIDQRY